MSPAITLNLYTTFLIVIGYKRIWQIESIERPTDRLVSFLLVDFLLELNRLIRIMDPDSLKSSGPAATRKVCSERGFFFFFSFSSEFGGSLGSVWHDRG